MHMSIKACTNLKLSTADFQPQVGLEKMASRPRCKACFHLHFGLRSFSAQHFNVLFFSEEYIRLSLPFRLCFANAVTVASGSADLLRKSLAHTLLQKRKISSETSGFLQEYLC